MSFWPSILPHFHIHFGRKSGEGGGDRSLSLGLVPTGHRTVAPMPSSLESLVPSPTDKNIIIKKTGADPVRDTVPMIQRMVARQLWQGRKLAAKLKGKTDEETARNDWNFIMKYIQYAQDPAGQEQVRSLRRLVADKKGDCDCYTSALLNLLINQGLKPKIRIAKYNGASEFSHIYVIVPKSTGGYITVDPVVHQFNYEVPFTEKKDFDMKLVGLDGFGECGVQKKEDPASDVFYGKNPSTYFTVPSKGLRYQGLVKADEMLESINLPYSGGFDGEGTPVYHVRTPTGVKQINQLIPLVQKEAIKQSLLTPPVQVRGRGAAVAGFTDQQKKNAAIALLSISAVGLGLSLLGSNSNAGANPSGVKGLGSPSKKMAVVHI